MSIEEVRKLIIGSWVNDIDGTWTFSKQENDSSFGILTLVNSDKLLYQISFDSKIGKHVIALKDRMTYEIIFIYENVLILEYKTIEHRFLKIKG